MLRAGVHDPPQPARAHHPADRDRRHVAPRVVQPIPHRRVLPDGPASLLGDKKNGEGGGNTHDADVVDADEDLAILQGGDRLRLLSEGLGGDRASLRTFGEDESVVPGGKGWHDDRLLGIWICARRFVVGKQEPGTVNGRLGGVRDGRRLDYTGYRVAGPRIRTSPLLACTCALPSQPNALPANPRCPPRNNSSGNRSNVSLGASSSVCCLSIGFHRMWSACGKILIADGASTSDVPEIESDTRRGFCDPVRQNWVRRDANRNGAAKARR